VDWPEPAKIHPRAGLANVAISILLIAAASRSVSVSTSSRWSFSMAQLLAACVAVGVALHLLQHFHAMYVRRDLSLWMRNPEAIIYSLGVVYGSYRATLALCQLSYFRQSSHAR
jgi:hypothetical protein